MKDKCFICQENLLVRSHIISKKKGIMRLINSSLQRQDDKHLQLEKLSTVPVHIDCSVKYNRSSDIALSLKKMKLTQQKKKELRATGKQEKSLIIENKEVDSPEREEKVNKQMEMGEYYDEMKHQIIKNAASIIRKDIGMMFYDHLHNRNSNETFVLDQSNIPESLDLFLSTMFSKKSRLNLRNFEYMSLAHSFFANCLLNITKI